MGRREYFRKLVVVGVALVATVVPAVALAATATTVVAPPSTTSTTIVARRFRRGAHRVRTGDFNATLRNESDFVTVGHVFPGDRFYILSLKRDIVFTFCPNPSDSSCPNRASAECYACFSRNPANPDRCRPNGGEGLRCQLQFAWGYVRTKQFRGCAWIETTHLIRLHNADDKVDRLLMNDKQARKCVHRPKRPFRYSRLAADRTPRCRHCLDPLTTRPDPSPLVCATSRCTGGAGSCVAAPYGGTCPCSSGGQCQSGVCQTPPVAITCHIKTRRAAVVFPNFADFKLKTLNILDDAGRCLGPTKAGTPCTDDVVCKGSACQGGLCVGGGNDGRACGGDDDCNSACEWGAGSQVTNVPKGAAVGVRYVTRSAKHVPTYAMVLLSELPVHTTQWGFIRLDHLDLQNGDLENCKARQILKPASAGDANWGDAPVNGCPSTSAVAGLQAASLDAIPRASATGEPSGEMCTPEGGCVQGDYCATDGTCAQCEDDTCSMSSDTARCIEGNPSCDLCEGPECNPPLATCSFTSNLYGPVPSSGTIDCDGHIGSPGAVAHGTVRLLRLPDHPSELEVLVDLQGAAPMQTYTIRVWEAGSCGDNSVADTGETIETDTFGSGDADFILPLPWSPSGTDALGDGLGSEAVVLVLDDAAGVSPSGERFTLNGSIDVRPCRIPGTATAVVVQADGRVVAAGSSAGQFALVRYHPDGTVDTTFGDGGVVTTRVGSGGSGVNALLAQGDGKLVAAGYASTGTDDDFALVRYDENGILDPTFGGGGTVTTALGTADEEIFALVLQGDGKLVAGGRTFDGSVNNWALVRYNADGSADTTFGAGGTVTTSFGGSGGPVALAVQSDGRIIGVGKANAGFSTYFGSVRFTSNGTLDSTFGTGGKVQTLVGSTSPFPSAQANEIVVQSDGKLVVAGWAWNGNDYDFGLVRYHPSGSVDTTFGSAGKVVTQIGGDDIPRSLLLQGDGKLVAAGNAGGAFALARYDAGGALDPTFGTGGVVTTAPRGSGDTEGVANALVRQADGKLIAAGYSGSSFAGRPFHFALVRYGVDGTIDPTFIATE